MCGVKKYSLSLCGFHLALPWESPSGSGYISSASLIFSQNIYSTHPKKALRTKHILLFNWLIKIIGFCNLVAIFLRLFFKKEFKILLNRRLYFSIYVQKKNLTIFSFFSPGQLWREWVWAQLVLHPHWEGPGVTHCITDH